MATTSSQHVVGAAGYQWISHQLPHACHAVHTELEKWSSEAIFAKCRNIGRPTEILSTIHTYPSTYQRQHMYGAGLSAEWLATSRQTVATEHRHWRKHRFAAVRLFFADITWDMTETGDS